MENIQLEVPVEKLTPMEAADQVIKLERLEKQVKTRMLELRAKLLTAMKDQDVISLKTGSYTTTRAVRRTLKIEDQATAIDALKKMNIEVVTEVVMADQMKPVLKQLLEEGKNVDGVQMTSTEYVSIRLPKEA